MRFIRLNMHDKVVYLVLAYSLDTEAAPVICSVCDNADLAQSYCEDVYEMNHSYSKIDIVEYKLNCLEAW